ncbi:alanine racemase [Microbulbifer hydrolyticus]|uniref:Alanine racemase n=1 Tax=Microbulbifer hydrolyticus TaxID=48074 RepID=A0A6P1TBK1_9GAMM|nr:alanine racemase [Microbulbifer hydrolyticus]MBB5212512.1 alanine racemase [Microbulbifer hydrolyticus]QHQ40138.1 alanine racemase [Microbulbifer hydrolyticus]
MTISEQEREGLLTIDLGALVDNYRWLRGQLRSASECGAVVKADAYGLGVAQVAPALFTAGCRSFFVATQREGEQLRSLLPPEATIYVLTGVRPGCEQACAQAGLIPVLVTTAQVQRWCDFTMGMGGDASLAAPAALKVDSGMTRLGMGGEEFAALLPQTGLLRRANLQLFLSHLACADEADHAQNVRQLQVFSGMLTQLRKVCPQVRASFANSAGICLGEEFQFDLVRPGSALYGVNPVPAQPNPMRPVVNLRLPVLQLRQVSSDCAVGYGATQTAVAGSWLAVVRGGYADGILRAQSGRGYGMAVVGNEAVRVPMLGRVSMDTTIFDVSALSETQRSQLALIEVLGASVTVDDVGTAAGTIGYEILTSLGHRYCRQYC